MKDLLLNVGSGGGAAAAAPGAGGAAAAAGGAADEAAPAEEEKKEEGTFALKLSQVCESLADHCCCNREGRIRRGYGLRSLRLSVPVLCTALLPPSRRFRKKRSFTRSILQSNAYFPALRAEELDYFVLCEAAALCLDQGALDIRGQNWKRTVRDEQGHAKTHADLIRARYHL